MHKNLKLTSFWHHFRHQKTTSIKLEDFRKTKFPIFTSKSNYNVKTNKDSLCYLIGTLDGTRTRVAGVRGQRPRPLDDESITSQKARTIQLQIPLKNLQKLFLLCFV